MKTVFIIALYILALVAPIWLFVIAATVATYVHLGAPVILIALLIDVQFAETIPYYILTTASLVVCIEFVRPYLAVQ